MGREKETTTIDNTSKQTQEVTQTAEEKELNKLLLDRVRSSQAGTLQVQQQGLDLASQLLTGGELPGFLKGLPQGISEATTKRIVDKSLEDVGTSAQFSGILDSGVTGQIATETAAGIRAQAEQFNLQNLLQLLNVGVGGQAQIQAPIAEATGQLGGALAGLRSITGTSSGHTTQQTIGMNPFLKSFQQSFGSSLGEATVGGLKQAGSGGFSGIMGG